MYKNARDEVKSFCYFLQKAIDKGLTGEYNKKRESGRV